MVTTVVSASGPGCRRGAVVVVAAAAPVAAVTSAARGLGRPRRPLAVEAAAAWFGGHPVRLRTRHGGTNKSNAAFSRVVRYSLCAGKKDDPYFTSERRMGVVHSTGRRCKEPLKEKKNTTTTSPNGAFSTDEQERDDGLDTLRRDVSDGMPFARTCKTASSVHAIQYSLPDTSGFNRFQQQQRRQTIVHQVCIAA